MAMCKAFARRYCWQRYIGDKSDIELTRLKAWEFIRTYSDDSIVNFFVTVTFGMCQRRIQYANL